MSCDQVLRSRSLTIGDLVVSLHADLAPTPRAVGQSRALIASALSGGAARLIDDEIVFNAQLVASELVTNVVLHARTQLSLGVCHDGRKALIAVADGASGAQVIDLTNPPRDDRGEGESGRGMVIVATLADDFGWSWREDTGGKIMWALLDLAPNGSMATHAVP
ncbi:MAG TPA: ATP-binding protein [Mycobacteriales bacterium]|nr:ATP-binding protein [Mycobacteriales bacterium]